MSTLLDLMRDSKTPLVNGKAQSLKAQLKLKGHDPKLDVHYKMTKKEIDDMAAFYASAVPPVVRRAKGNARAFRKAQKELENDCQGQGQGRHARGRQLFIAWKTVAEKYERHLDDAIDMAEKRSLDKGKSLKKLEDDFAPRFNAFDAALTDDEL